MKTLRHRLGPAIAAVAILTLTLTSCSEDSESPDAGPSATASASTEDPTEDPTSDPTSDPTKVPDIGVDPDTGELDFCDKQTKPFTGSAPEEFGQEKVKQAYCDMVQLQYQYGFVPALWNRPFDGSEFREIEFSQIRPYLTVDAREDWDQSVEQFVQETDEDAATDMYGLMGFAALVQGFSFADPTDEPLYYNLKISPARTGVDRSESEPRLLLVFTVSVDLNMFKDGERVFLPWEKEISYHLLDNGDHPEIPWLIDAWTHKINVGEVQPYDPPIAEDQ